MPDRMIDRIKARRGTGSLPVDTNPTIAGGQVGGGSEAAGAPDGSSPLDMLNNVLKGFTKKAGETAFSLGNVVHKTPGVGNVTDALAQGLDNVISGHYLSKNPTPVDVDAAFKTVPEDLQRHGGAQDVGAGLENIAEFMLPGGASQTVGRGITKGLVKQIPNTASPQMMSLLNKLAAYTGRIAGPAVEGGTISAAHGSEHPEHAAEAEAGGAAVTEALASAAKLLSTSYGRRAATVLAASGLMSHFPDVGNLSGMMGLYGLIRDPMKNVLEQPGVVPAVQRGIRWGGDKATDILGAVADTATPKRRELKP